MLYRDHSNQSQEIEIFAGLRTGGQIADTNPTINFNQTNTMKIVVNTTGNGSRFTADFLLDQGSGFASVSGGPLTINLSLNEINFVGMSFDDATSMNVTVDNYLLKKLRTYPRTVGDWLILRSLRSKMCLSPSLRTVLG